ncbi:MAG: arginine--tRNA ligase [Flavobacteriales bacterium Tduv]
MKNSIQNFTTIAQLAFSRLYNLQEPKLELLYTRKEFKGDVTLVLFPLAKKLKKSLEQLGQEIGSYIQEHTETIESFHLIKGFLNFQWKDDYYTRLFEKMTQNGGFQFKKDPLRPAVMVEYSSPNTNKPLHLGHIRNILLGHSVAMLFKAIGREALETQIINDRGIHICKSMVAWEKFGEGQTPQSTGIKGDHFVGKYYVAFDKAWREETQSLCAQGHEKKQAEQEASLMQGAREVLRQWESGDPKTLDLWRKMNQFVYDGFTETYRRLGIYFDIQQYESQTYLLGKNIVKEGLQKGVFYQKRDGSVWVDLSDDGLEEKLLLRADSTSVYMTQDLGTAVERFKNYPIDTLIYTVGEEQDYHFQVLFLILKRLGYSWTEKLYHLSYGMVNLSSGKMKSREGTVVYADDLMEEMYRMARKITQESEKLEGYSGVEKEKLFEMIGQGALKYYILKVDPKKRILFDPVASIDFKGHTGTYIQYTYARIRSLERKSSQTESRDFHHISLNDYERTVIKTLEQYPFTVQSAAENLSPALIANYVYELAKIFNDFYQNIRILNAKESTQSHFRVKLSAFVGNTLRDGMKLLGIPMPERM